MPDKTYISKITLPSGTTYEIKDIEARERIEALGAPTHFLGTTASNISDKSTTNPVMIDNESVTAKAGDIVVHNNAEFIWDGAKWLELGDLSGLGALAKKNSASGTYTPAGSVSTPTFSGSELTSSGSYTPEGSVVAPTFIGTEGDISVSGTPAGDITLTKTAKTVNATGTFTPVGSVNLTKTSKDIDVAPVADAEANYTPAGSVTLGTENKIITGSATVTGTVSAPAVDVTPTTDTEQIIDSVGTQANLTTTVSGEILTISWTANMLPTKKASKAFMTNASAALHEAPTFTQTTGTTSATVDDYAASATFAGTGVHLQGSISTADSAVFTGTEGNIAASGSVSTADSATFAGTALTSTGKFTPAGTNSAPAFTGAAGTVSVSGTPEGTISQPIFTGTEAAITVF